MIQLRLIFVGVLSVLLVLTGLSRVEARGVAAATGQMVLCVGDTTVVVYVDTDGVPTTAPYFCPECVASEAAAALPVLGQLVLGQIVRLEAPCLEDSVSPSVFARSAVARGPPGFV